MPERKPYAQFDADRKALQVLEKSGSPRQAQWAKAQNAEIAKAVEAAMKGADNVR